MRLPLLVAALVAVPALAACTENAPSGGGGGDTDAAAPRSMTVSSTDSACDLSATEAPAGTLTFDVVNTGSQVTEFYLLGEDGLRIVGEVENIGPALNRQLVVNAPAGKYVTACKPGMKGEGIRADFTVTESDEAVQVSADDQELVAQAQQNYAAYVQDQSDQLLVKTQRVRRRLRDRERRRRRAPSTPTPAPTGSGSRPWPSPSVTSTPRWTPARRTSSPARSGPAGT